MFFVSQLLNWSAQVAVRFLCPTVPQWVAAHCEPATRMPKKKMRSRTWKAAHIILGLALQARCLSQYHQQLY